MFDMGAVWRGQFEGNPFLGLFARACDKVALIPKSSLPKFEEGAKALGAAKIIRTSVDGSPYLGLFIAMNNNGAAVPKMTTPQEVAEIKGSGLDVCMLDDTKFCAIGNNVACNSHGALFNPDMPNDDIRKIADCLGVPYEKIPIAGYRCPGMACVATDKGWVAHNRINEEEAAMLESLFKCKGSNASVNSGTALVGAGVCATTSGAMIGERSSGFEVARISQALDIV